MNLLALVAFAAMASATEPIYYNRTVEDQRDVGSINENFRTSADAARRNDLTNGGTISGSLTISGAGSGLTFADGSVQTVAAAVTNWVSSATRINPISVTATACGVCQATVTFTSPTATDVYAVWVNAYLNGSAAMDGRSCILLDGVIVNNGVGSNTMFAAFATASATGSMGGYREMTALSVTAASHSWCVSFFTNTGTLSSSASLLPSFGIVKIR